MLVWGSATININKQLNVEKLCLGCGNNNFILSAVQHYEHIWFLPLFPRKKTFGLICANCGSTIINENIEQLCEGIDKSYFKTPMLSYIGWIIIAVILVIGILSEKFTNKDHIVSPKNTAPINYEIKNNYQELKQYDFLILHDPKELGYILARVLKIDNSDFKKLSNDSNPNIYSIFKLENVELTIQFSKWIYKKETTLLDLVTINNKPFNNDFYFFDYEVVTIKDLERKFPLVKIITRKDNPKINKSIT